MLDEKTRDPRPLVGVVEHTSLPPAVDRRPGGILAITQNTFSLFSQAPATASSSGGEGSAAVAPSIPVDRVTRGGSGSRARSKGANPRASRQGRPTDARVDETPTPGENPSQRGSGSNQSRDAHHTAQRHRGARESIKMASLNIKGRRSGEIDKWMHVPQIM